MSSLSKNRAGRGAAADQRRDGGVQVGRADPDGEVGEREIAAHGERRQLGQKVRVRRVGDQERQLGQKGAIELEGRVVGAGADERKAGGGRGKEAQPDGVRSPPRPRSRRPSPWALKNSFSAPPARLTVRRIACQ